MIDSPILDDIDREMAALEARTDALEQKGGQGGIGLFRKTRVGQLRTKIDTLRHRRDRLAEGRSLDEPGALLADIRVSLVGV